MDTLEVTDFENVCRICMKYDKEFLKINSFKIIDMVIACASVQIWENDDLPNQICNACFLQLQNTINFKQMCESSDKAFRQIIQRNKINSNQINFINVKDEEFEDYADDNSIIDIKEEDILENAKNENTLENIKIRIGQNQNDSGKLETDNIRNKNMPEMNEMQISINVKEENDTCKHIKEEENVTETFNCEKCNKEFRKAWILSQHMYRKHRAKPLKCNKCKIKCYHSLHLKEHQELAHNTSNLTCKKCNQICSNIYKLKYHKCKQISSKLLQCSRCDKSFNDKQELKCHNKEEHVTLEKYVTCHICGKSVTKKNIKVHLVIHEERNTIKCDVCSKTFLHQKNLERHVKVLHEKQIRARNYLCNICGHASLSAPFLRKHLRTHSTERPYACEHCDKTYRSELNLKEHVSKVHLNQRRFQCTFCSQAFFEKRHLVHHERRHTGEKPHKCEVCGKRFIQKIALKIHMKTHTNSSENLMQS
ncbi:zinc finger protein OZF-like isoform X1 [Chrysoperla carnea]|uniref:zinc finger protein OZF-like isoform X1 n=1 Tax=Chrysoperla carnea TaxID=189513 RepID=UPI001D08CE5C|nr:zinc finger protein OZF-like isoform X1 [Chrysoperla carnea]